MANSVKVVNSVLQINKQTDDSTFLAIQTRLSDKKKREISDCLNDTLTNPCGQKFAKTTLPSNTENISNVGRTEKNSSDTEWPRTYCRLFVYLFVKLN
jgi:hypothetical protein